jgi:hypothetical protein
MKKSRCNRRSCRGQFQKGQHIEEFEGKEFHVACAASERKERKLQAAKRQGQKPSVGIPLIVLLVWPLLYWSPQR